VEIHLVAYAIVVDWEICVVWGEMVFGGGEEVVVVLEIYVF
jgi:hypothetical protein